MPVEQRLHHRGMAVIGSDDQRRGDVTLRSGVGFGPAASSAATTSRRTTSDSSPSLAASISGVRPNAGIRSPLRIILAGLSSLEAA